MFIYAMFLLLICLPIVAVFLFWLVKNKTTLYSISVITSSLLLIVFFELAGLVMQDGRIEAGSIFRFYLDSLSIIYIAIALIIGLVVSIYNIGYLNTELRDEKLDIKKMKIFYILLYILEGSIILSLITGNMGIMWIAIESSSLAAGLLVGFYRDKKSLEAAWKYIIICSAGIALALLGIIFLNLASVDIAKGIKVELYWPYIYDHASELKISVLRLSFIFILLGFGTKAGLAPMHTWLPDAHSQAPTPISAMLSGVLINAAMYGIMREIAIANKCFGSNIFTGRLMLGIGIGSILIVAIFVIKQKDYKRILAYSSIEHMGIITFGLGVFTPAAVFASLLHTINHSLTKTMLFFCAGNVQLKYHTREIGKVTGLLRVLPVTGSVFLIGIFAITGMPPFSVFSTELAMLISTFKAGHSFLGVLLIFALAVVFLGFAISLFKMFYGSEGKESTKAEEPNKSGVVICCILLIVITISGLYIPQEILRLLTNAQKIITGG